MSKYELKIESKYKEIEVFEFSDTHNESRAKSYPSKLFFDETFWVKPNKDPQVYSILILAGDIFNLKKVGIAKDLLGRYCEDFDLVLYVFGNHEYYGTKFGRAEEKLKEATKHLDNLYILQNDKLELKTETKKIVFLGTTLWFDFDKKDSNMKLAERKIQGMNGDVFALGDFQFIKNQSYGLLRSYHIYGEFSKSYKFLSEEFKNTKESDIVCVITHHAPSLLSATHFNDENKKNPIEQKMENNEIFVFGNNKPVFEREELDEYSFMYMSDLHKLIFEYQPYIWFHGHIHKKRNYYLNKTLVYSNPVGFKEYGSNKTYEPSKVACFKIKI